jgi:hypothetical protein
MYVEMQLAYMHYITPHLSLHTHVQRNAVATFNLMNNEERQVVSVLLGVPVDDNEFEEKPQDRGRKQSA